MSKKNKSLLVGNWKMNPQSLDEAKKIFSAIKRKATKLRKTDIVICPPFPFIASLAKSLSPGISVGGQDIHFEAFGAFTGEVSAQQIISSGATYGIVGHSERRAMGETDDLINKKVKTAVSSGLKVILCIGEASRDHEGHYLEFLKTQIKNALAKISLRYLEEIVIAYEPIWAIGKSDKDAMKGSDMQETALFIRKTLTELYGEDPARNVPILYGGSVSPANTIDIFGADAISGLLVGRQSLVPESFSEILGVIESRK